MSQTPIPADVLKAFEDGRIPEGISLEYLAENRDYGPLVAMIFVGVLTTIIVLLRTYARLFLVRKFGMDDLMALVALSVYIAFLVLSILLLNLGSGRHMDYIMHVLTVDQLSETEVLDFVGHIIYAFQLYIARVSGLAFYWRLSHKHIVMQKYIKIGACFITVATIPQLFLVIFHCLPVTAQWPYGWQAEVNNYKCLSWGLVYTVNSALSLSCDLVLFTIPAALISLLRTNRRSKITLSLVLFPGVLVIAISIARIYLVVRGGWDLDGSWFYSPQLAVQNAEMGGTLIALSVPGLKSFFGTLFDKIGGRSESRSAPTQRSASAVANGSSHNHSRKHTSAIVVMAGQDGNESKDSLLTLTESGQIMGPRNPSVGVDHLNDECSEIVLGQIVKPSAS